MVEEVISQAGRQLMTVKFDYTEKDGSNEGQREVEPYSYREKVGEIFFFGYDIQKQEIRMFRPSMIGNIIMTGNPYSPRWPVEV